jgi:Ca-activated chloride channel family protein
MLTEYGSARRSRLHRLAPALVFCIVLAAACLGASPPEAGSVESAATLSTGVVPTLGINEITEGTLLFRTKEAGRLTPAPILKTDVQIAVTGTIARATVRQEFTNPSTGKGDWLEGIYVFPLPETAAVDHLRMKIGERIIEGQIKERAEAKKVYERAKQEGKRTSLLDQERPNIFTTSVANIGPAEHITIEIEYQETVRYGDEQFTSAFPWPWDHVTSPARPSSSKGRLLKDPARCWTRTASPMPRASPRRCKHPAMARSIPSAFH